jgi:hypothetical protein
MSRTTINDNRETKQREYSVNGTLEYCLSAWEIRNLPDEPRFGTFPPPIPVLETGEWRQISEVPPAPKRRK